MARGEVSDDDLARGLRGFGGVTPFSSTGKPIRDNPFRDTQAQPRPVEAARKVEPVAVEKEPQQAETVERRGEKIASAIAAKPKREIVPKAAVRRIEPREVERPSAAAAERPGENKTERYPERVTVPLDAELRDSAESFAREISRRRDDKAERITTNTIMRVALRLLLEEVAPSFSASPNNEEEIFSAVCEHVRAKQHSEPRS
jgi:hypothetical protein